MSEQQPKLKLMWSVGGAVVAFVAALGLGRYVAGSGADASTKASASASAAEPQDAKAKVVYKIPVSMSQASTGPADALVTLVQWCDLPDAGCKAAEPAVQAALKKRPTEVRLVFRHFMTPSKSSTMAHSFSRAALEYGNKFWEARTLLLNHQGEVTLADLERYSAQLGLDWSVVKKSVEGEIFGQHLAADLLFSTMFEVDSTPAIFANGRRLVGPVTEDSLDRLITAEVQRSKELLATGVAKENLYAELTKNGVWLPVAKDKLKK